MCIFSNVISNIESNVYIGKASYLVPLASASLIRLREFNFALLFVFILLVVEASILAIFFKFKKAGKVFSRFLWSSVLGFNIWPAIRVFCSIDK
jgi:cell shape-determining protein MreD